MDHGDHSSHEEHHQANHAHTEVVAADHLPSHPIAAHEASGHDQADHGRDSHAAHAAHTDHTGHELLFRNRFWVCLILSVPVLLYSPMLQEWLGFTPPAFPGSQWVAPVLSVVIFVVGGLPFLGMARDEWAARRPGMMMLISLAISVAFVYSLAAVLLSLGESFFWELVTLIDVMLLGHWLEMRSVRQASGALDALAKLLPDTAERIAPNGQVETVRAAALAAGDLVLVRPGASVPADGEVEVGETAINEAMVSGESAPVDKQPGDRVIAGTVNAGDGALRVRVTAVGEETALSGIMRLVAEAQRSRSRAQLLADRAAGWLFYVALAAAALTAIIWLAVVGLDQEVLLRVVTVLVIACPHALGLAVPLVVALTTSLAASSGILVRDRPALENARAADVVLFDKTGTLTKGEQGVVGLATVEGQDGDEALALAAAVEGDSEHMIARALRDHAAALGRPLPAVSGFEALKGRGVVASVNGERVHVGGPRLLEHLGLDAPAALADFARRAGEQGQTVVYLARDGRPAAAFALADVIRPESREAIAALHDMGLEVAMITGDSEAVARSVSGQLGLDRIFAQVLPEDKEKHVRALQAEGKRVIMVGDGVNDAPALARADVGVAIGGGTDVAIESAGIILVKSDPQDVARLIRLSRASYRKMVQNIWWAAGYNVVAIPLAAGVLAPWGILPPPALGAALMALSTIIVALNAQTLRRLKL
ncbi:heavy metal translocating P-type ATPase [Promineifilum sp.]|uniref:heavy metal translocating P-type ATPase n=1 Tax=Promineifilum sp. TaxID=2664178 RepID=UPI0035B09A22